MMAMTQASSRLEVLQARFQQKQMQEKEQKLLQLYDQQQQRAYQVVKRGSAGSTGSVQSQQHSVTRTTTTTTTSSTSQGGKVRQMFHERRQTPVKGIDRSYPLEPLDTKPKRQIASNGHLPSKANQNNTVVRQTVTVKRTARADINSSVGGGKPIVSYQEEVSQQTFRNKNHNDEYDEEDDSSPNETGVHIEEILNDDTIERNRMLAKIHLMEYDKNLRNRVNIDLNNEQFPEDLMIDVPDKLPRKPVAKKLSQAEARLERFKNSCAKKSNANVTTTVNSSESRKKSEPMFRSARSTSRGSTVISKTTETIKVNRTATKPFPRPVPIQDPKTIPRKNFTSRTTKLVELNRSTKSVEAPVPSKTLTPLKPVRSTEPELVQTSMPIIKSLVNSPRIQKSPSPELGGDRSTNSTTRTPIRRSFPSSPTRSADVMTRRGSANSKSPEPRPVRKPFKGAPKHHEAANTANTNSALEEPRGTNIVGTSNLENSPESQTLADDRKSSTRSPTGLKNNVKAFVADVDEHPRQKASAAITKQPSRRLSNERKSTTQNQRHPSPTVSPSPRPPSALSTASSTTSSARGGSSTERQLRNMATKAKNPTRSPGATSKTSTRGPPPLRNDSTVLSSDALVACKICGRRFAQDRVSLHEKICSSTGQKKRKQFNTALHRVQGTELEAFAKKSAPTGRQAEYRLKAKKTGPNTKSNWRRKHEDFINAIRSAKQVQAHLAAGGKLSDLPPPPASDTSDYIQCPHCGRKFNHGAAERHIPKCATMMHNKPNPRAPPKPKR